MGFAWVFVRCPSEQTVNDQLIEQIAGTKAIISKVFVNVFISSKPQTNFYKL